MSMSRQRVMLITLGVADLERTRGFYTSWGWQSHGGTEPGIVFSQMQGAVLALFGRDELAAGAKLLKRPGKVFWGGYCGYFADPDGHVWEIAMNPLWPLSGDGSLTLPGG